MSTLSVTFDKIRRNNMLINKELYKEYFAKDRKDNFINMDLDIFSTLNKMVEVGKIKNTYHKIFVFNYLWLVSYLWKHSKYSNTEIGVKDIKKILGISPIEKKVDYLIKKHGVLEEASMIETTRDFPMYTDFSNDSGIKITKLSDLEENIREEWLKRFNSRYICKKPLMQYEREGKVGLMFSKDNTIPITMFEFTRIVLCSDLGIEGLYVYAYLKMKSKLRGYTPTGIMYYEFEKVVGYKEKKIRSIILNLELAGMIEIKREIQHDEDNRQIVGQHNKYSICHKGV